jgi:phosphoglycolate phosphatase
MIKGIIFDYDGVIVDSFPTVFEVYKIICEELAVDAPQSIEDFYKVYGYSAKTARENLGIIDIEKSNQIFNREILKRRPELFAGIPEVLTELASRYKLFLITANLNEEAVQKLRFYELDNHFNEVVGVVPGKRVRKADQIKTLLDKYNLVPDEVVYIGDREIDLDIASEAEVKNVVLTEYGWGYDKERFGSVPSVKTAGEIPSAVAEFDK